MLTRQQATDDSSIERNAGPKPLHSIESMNRTHKTIFQRMTAKDRRSAGVDPVRSRDPFTPAELAKFYTLPLERKEWCLARLGDVIRDAESASCPATAGALQRVYDDWYKTVAQEQADRVFSTEASA